MSAKNETSRVASKVEDLKWFEAVAEQSESILTNVPQEDKSTWYRKYESIKDAR